MRRFQNNLLKIAFFSLLLSASSCKKYLNLEPQDGIIRQNFWKTKEQLQAAVIGCYASLLTGTPRSLSETLFLWGELRGGMLSPTLATTNEETDILNSNILSSNSITNWRPLYATINYCNTVLKFGPDVLNQDNTLTQASLDASLGEVKALRALMYFYLVRSFGDVPLVLKATSSDQELEQLPKSTQQEVLTQIVKDLSEAEPVLPEAYSDNASTKGRVTRYMVNALQADVALWMEKYDVAVTACDKIINSKRYGLVSGLEWFNSLWLTGNSGEGIFELQFDAQNLNTFRGMLLTRSRFTANPVVMEEVYTQDFVDDTKKDLRGDLASVRATDNTIWKYVGASSSSNNTVRATEQSYAHWIVYRYAEVLLMKAEALAQMDGRGQEALDLIARIRARATALVATEQAPPATDKIGITNYILDERAREFAFEGKRWYDILRFAKRNNYAQKQILLDVVSSSVPSDRQQGAIAKARDVNSHYFPIYDYELQTDKNLVQNPFYK